VLDYLLAHPVLDEPEQDDWRERCSKSFQATAYALCKLSQQKQNNWPKDRWRDALQAWAEEKLPDCSWRYMAPVVAGAPDDFLKAVSRNISGWLEAVAKTFEDHEDHFLTLARRILQLDFEDDNDADDPVPRAINHPVGHVVQAFLDWWYRQRPNDCQELPDSIKPIFTELCDTRIAKFRHGRVLLAAHTTSLFYVDKTWSEEHLLPLFDWHRSETEARAAWAGFLRSPRLYRPYRPLMEAIKPDFLDTVNHYADLGQYKEPFAAFLTFAALDPGDTFNTKELSEAIGTLPPDGLRASTQALMQAQEAAGDRREEFWRNRVQPFWKKIWPKSKDQAPNVSAESLARLCVAAGEEFPSAVTVLGSWLRPYQYPNYVIYLLHEANLSARFPEKALDFLNIILADLKSVAERQKLRECLDAIAQAAPTLRENLKFVQLELLVRP
jgi:hypothetical protein